MSESTIGKYESSPATRPDTYEGPLLTDSKGRPIVSFDWDPFLITTATTTQVKDSAGEGFVLVLGGTLGNVTILNTTSDDQIVTSAGLAIGGTTTAVSTTAFYYMIGGAGYYKAAVAAGTAPGNDVIPQSKYGAVALDIGTDGTIDAIEASDNATGYTTAALAAAGLPDEAASHLRMGYVTATKSDGAFTFGTTALNAANTTVAYTSTTAGGTLLYPQNQPVADTIILGPIKFSNGLAIVTAAATYINGGYR